jgi:uncharacterized damage-inducible protein DinB
MDVQQARTILNYMTQVWEGEFAATCKVLAAVPESGRDYRPDEKSRTAWELASHLAAADIWFLDAIRTGNFAWDPDSDKRVMAANPTCAQLSAMYKETFPKKLAGVRALSDADLTKIVDFLGMMQQPNVTYLGFANNHSIHHRGQLASYLRAMGSKVPAIYGVSADEPMPS